MPTVADVLKRIERLKKDLEYVRTFQEKWREQRDRFPKIYEGIVEQEKAFVRKIDDLRQLKVELPFADPLFDEAIPPTGTFPAQAGPAPAEDDAVAAKPRIAPAGDGLAGANGEGGRTESSEDKRAAVAEIGEKLRKRGAPTAPVVAAAPEPAAASAAAPTSSDAGSTVKLVNPLPS